MATCVQQGAWMAPGLRCCGTGKGFGVGGGGPAWPGDAWGHQPWGCRCIYTWGHQSWGCRAGCGRAPLCLQALPGLCPRADAGDAGPAAGAAAGWEASG